MFPRIYSIFATLLEHTDTEMLFKYNYGTYLFREALLFLAKLAILALLLTIFRSHRFGMNVCVLLKNAVVVYCSLVFFFPSGQWAL